MNDKTQQIDELFSMFHDFEIVGINVDDENCVMEILLPWSEMWNIENYVIKIYLKNFKNLECHYFKRTSNKLIEWEKGAYYPSDEFITSDPKEIVKLELDIQRHDYIEPDKFILHCNSSSSFGNKIGQIEFARIVFNAKDYEILDNENNRISLTKMKEWHKQWWAEIDKIN